uniref:Uncharacterized protein n=1 Tax=Anguilla anguilla TaxID=7936 RepID=A0A0E9WP41_ANGAN
MQCLSLSISNFALNIQKCFLKSCSSAFTADVHSLDRNENGGPTEGAEE